MGPAWLTRCVTVPAAGRPRHRHDPSGRRTPRRASVLAIGRILAAALSFTLLLGFGYGWYEYRSFKAGVNRFDLNNLGQAPAGATTTPKHTVHGTDQNILLVGLDSRDGLSAAERRLLQVGNDQSLSTDTIMILHVPADGRRATMISIPRDSYVDIPGGWAKNKINAAYGDAYSDAERKGATHEQAEAAGADLLVKTVSEFTGLRIDHYVQVGFGGFYTIAKALKSVPVTLCAATDDTRRHDEITGQGGGSGFKMSAGPHDLTPLQALEFVRQRHNLAGGDLAREKRQRYFIAAAFGKIASARVLLDPSRLSALIDAIHGAFYVDRTFDLVGFAGQLADLSAGHITGFTIPVEGTGYENIVGSEQDVVHVDPASVRPAIEQRLNPVTTPAPSSSSSTPRPSSSASSVRRSTAPPPAAHGCVY